MARDSVLFVINPNSGTKLGSGTIDTKALIERCTDEAGYYAQCVVTQAAGHATELATEAVTSGAYTAVVAVGGDGTVNETARGLRHSTLPLGILPMGSGNGLARHLGIPLTMEEALLHFFRSSVQIVDSATLNGQPFFCVAGLGFDAYVSQQFGQQSHRGWDTYVRVSMQAYLEYQPQKIKVAGVEIEVFSLAFANAGQFGNNAWVAPQATLTDGLLEVCTVTPFPKWYGPVLAYQMFSKSLKNSEHVAYQSLPRYAVETDQPALVHFDGEPWQLNTNRIEVEVVPQSLRIRA